MNKLALCCLLLGLVACGDVASVAPVASDESAARRTCFSSAECAADAYCTTEDGVCDSACRPNVPCVDACAGTCKRLKNSACKNEGTKSYISRDPDQCAAIHFLCVEGMVPFFDECGCGCEVASGEACGPSTCAPGLVCCNESCGICTPPDGVCIQIACEPTGSPECASDADCRLEADYCTGCDCLALSNSESVPACDGPGVRCFADPCMSSAAVCVDGSCAVTKTALQ